MSSTKIKEVNPLQASDLLRSDKMVVLLDVRSRFEYEYVGHPEPSINIPWQEVPDWKMDPEFVQKVRHQLKPLSGEADPGDVLTVLTLCRSGKRSMDSAIRLADSGFARVINIAEGFEGVLDSQGHRGNVSGWRYRGLPWRQG